MSKIMDWRNSRLTLILASVLFAVPYSIIAFGIVDAPFVSILLISSIIFYILIGNAKMIKNKNLRLVYIVLAALKLGLLIYISAVKPPFLAGVDWYNFHNYAVTALQGGGSITAIYENSFDLFVFLLALIYNVFGIFVDQLYFYIFAASLVVFRYMYKTVRLLTDNEKVAIIAALVVMAWPVNVVFSVSLLREIPIQLAVIISFYNFVKYLKLRQRKNLIGAFVFSVIAAMMHSGMIAITAVYLYVLLQGKLPKKRKFISIGAIILASLAMFLVILSPVGANLTDRFSGIESVDDINNKYEFQLEASTTYITSTTSSFGDFVATAPYRVVMFAVAPLPWQVNSFSTFISFLIDGLLQIILLVFIFKALKKSKKSSAFMRNVVVTGALCVLVTYFIFAMGTNNYGSAMRHRTKILPVAIVLVSTYFITDNRKNISKQIKDRKGA